MKESEIILYTTPQGNVKVEIRFEGETFWLTQKKLAELFNVEVHTINYHLKEIFKSGELNENSVIRKIRTTATDGKTYLTNFYNLDAIIAVGLDYAENQASRQIPIKMEDWISKLDAFLGFNEYHILTDAGKISRQ